MRTNDERIAAMHIRAAKYRKYRTAQVVSIAAALLLTLIAAYYIPSLGVSEDMGQLNNGMIASIFSGRNTAGLFVVAMIAFLLGAAVTIFSFYLKKWYERTDR